MSTKADPNSDHGIKRTSWSVLVAIVIVIVVIAYLALGRGGSGGGSTGGFSLNSGSVSIINQLSSSRNQTPSGVANIVFRQISKDKQLEVQYAGVALIHYEGYNISIPVNMLFEKYGNDTRFVLNITDIPYFRSVNETQIMVANGTSYFCSSPGDLFSGKPSSLRNLTDATGVTCIEYKGNGSGGATQELGTYLDTLESNSITNATVTVLGTHSYKGQSCAKVRIIGSINGSVVSVSRYNFTTCLSGQYDLPLNLTLSTDINSTYSNYAMNIVLNETSIGTSTSNATVTSLPGPVTGIKNGSKSFGAVLQNGQLNITQNYFGNITNGTLNTQYQVSFDVNLSRLEQHLVIGCAIDGYYVPRGSVPGLRSGGNSFSNFPTVYYAVTGDGTLTEVNTSPGNYSAGVAGDNFTTNTTLHIVNLPCNGGPLANVTVPAGTPVSGYVAAWRGSNLLDFNTTMK